MNDSELQDALDTGNPYEVASLILRRSGQICFWKRGDAKRAEAYGRARQQEVYRSPAAQAVLLERDNLCSIIREYPPSSQQHAATLRAIWKLDNRWNTEFSVFEKERYRMAKQLEVKRVLRRYRHKLNFNQ